MNTLKYSNIYNKLTEQHDFKFSKIKHDVNIFDHSYDMYCPCNLNIFITNRCPNNCYFCINKNYQNTDISDSVYYNGLIQLFKILDGLPIEITLTGGEPTLDPERLIHTMQLCKVFGFKCRTVSTTGRNLLKKYKGKALCQWLVDYGFIHNINISRMSYYDDENKRIFQNDGQISSGDLKKLALFFKLNNADMRISLPFFSNKTYEYANQYLKQGFDDVIIREIIGNDSQKLIFNNSNCEKIESIDALFYYINVYRNNNYLIKYYQSKNNFGKNILYSLSYRNGILQKDFSIVVKDFNLEAKE